MARRPDKGIFTPTNPQKYIGPNGDRITYRSSWELSAMLMFDKHPSIINWASESLQIPYQNPVTGKWSVYHPDFVIIYVDKNGKEHREVVEVKPLKEVPGMQILSERTGRPRKQSQQDRLIQAINGAKWKAAASFCAKRGLYFRVVTENNLFG